MLVDLVELRERGVKLSRENVLARAPLRGELSLDEGQPGWYRGKKDAPLLASLVVPNGGCLVVAPLNHARVSKIRRGALLIFGLQQFSYSGRDKDLREFPQVWWCRIVGVQPAQTRTASWAQSAIGVAS